MSRWRVRRHGSATRIGDRFGLYACDATIRDACTVPPTKRPGIAAEVARRLASAPRSGDSAGGLLQAAERLVGVRKIVFLVSDFLLPLDFVRELFERLAPHDVIPVVIADSSEQLALPDWGLIELVDLETGGRRLVFMRPKLKARWLERLQAQRVAISRIAGQSGRAPVTICDAFDVDRFSRQLMET